MGECRRLESPRRCDRPQERCRISWIFRCGGTSRSRCTPLHICGYRIGDRQNSYGGLEFLAGPTSWNDEPCRDFRTRIPHRELRTLNEIDLMVLHEKEKAKHH